MSRMVGTCAIMLTLCVTALAQTDTSLRLEAWRLPLDTLVVGQTRIVGCAVPARAVQTPGDMNNDGKVSLSDAMSLVYHVLMGTPLPPGDTVAIPIERTDALGAKTLFTFVPRRPGVR